MENMEKKTPLNDLMRSTMEKIHEMVDTNTIVGQPINTADGVTLIELPEQAEEAMPACHLEAALRYAGEDGLYRDITLMPRGGFDFAPVEQALKEEGF